MINQCYIYMHYKDDSLTQKQIVSQNTSFGCCFVGFFLAESITNAEGNTV